MPAELGTETATLEKALHRLETLTATLDHVADPNAREAARELLELVLDLHGLALARMTSVVACAENGSALTEALIADPHVRAILLLHGLHPHDAKSRLRQVIERMLPQWDERGFRVDLLSVGTASARVRLYKNGSAEPTDELRQEIEQVLADAAPDLDDIFVEVEVAGSAVAAASVLYAG
jgi:hypothetical protein